MSVDKQYEPPQPPPRLLQTLVEVEVETVASHRTRVKRALVQASHKGSVYISVNEGTWPALEARAIAESILEILDQQGDK